MVSPYNVLCWEAEIFEKREWIGPDEAAGHVRFGLSERLLDGIHVFLNPNADYQFSQEGFDLPGVVQWGCSRVERRPFRVGEPTITCSACKQYLSTQPSNV
jgi:hypothetical protein